jgi:hypothetical protein
MMMNGNAMIQPKVCLARYTTCSRRVIRWTFGNCVRVMFQVIHPFDWMRQ